MPVSKGRGLFIRGESKIRFIRGVRGYLKTSVELIPAMCMAQCYVRAYLRTDQSYHLDGIGSGGVIDAR